MKLNMKLKTLVAAVALVAASGANAALDNIQSGNSSLAFIAVDFTGSPISVMMDLDFNIDSFSPGTAFTSAPGTLIQWDFGANTLTINGVASASTQTNWSGALSSFNLGAQTAETKWGVIAGDSLSAASSTTPIRYLSTVAPGTPLTGAGSVQNQTKSALSSFSGVNNLFNANSILQPVGGANGSTASSSTAYVGAEFGTVNSWRNNATGGWKAYANVGQTADFYQLDGNNGTSTSTALTTSYAGDFTYAAGVLTYQVAAIPEPETYTLMLAGLGMIGFMARRRLNNGNRA